MAIFLLFLFLFVVVPAEAAPPPAGTAGRLGRLSSGGASGALIIDDGTDWTCEQQKSMRLYIVTCPPYNAARDGSTDDAPEIQAAIDAAEAAGGGVVYLPEGNYAVLSTLVIDAQDVQLVGAGRDITIITAAVSLARVIHIGSGAAVTTDSGVQRMTIDRATGALPNPSIGVHFDKMNYGSLEDVLIRRHRIGLSVDFDGQTTAVSVGFISRQLYIEECSYAYIHIGFAAEAEFWQSTLGRNSTETNLPTYGIVFDALNAATTVGPNDISFYFTNVIPKPSSPPASTIAVGWIDNEDTTGWYRFHGFNTENLTTGFKTTDTSQVQFHLSDARIAPGAGNPCFDFGASSTVSNIFISNLLCSGTSDFDGDTYVHIENSRFGDTFDVNEGGVVVSGNTFTGTVTFSGSFTTAANSLVVTGNRFEGSVTDSATGSFKSWYGNTYASAYHLFNGSLDMDDLYADTDAQTLGYGMRIVNDGDGTDNANIGAGIQFSIGGSAGSAGRGKGGIVYAYPAGGGSWNRGDFMILQDSAADSGGAALTDVVLTIDNAGEVDIATISGDGTGKAVCIKSTGDLGTCTDAVGGSGTCTCS